MEKLFIEGTKQTPEIDFDGAKGKFKVSGKSYPENVNTFFEPVFRYIDEYKNNPAPKTKLEFTWLYYNTATIKMIMRIIMFLKESNTNFKLGWYYKEGFEMIKEKGEEIKDILGISVDIKQI